MYATMKCRKQGKRQLYPRVMGLLNMRWVPVLLLVLAASALLASGTAEGAESGYTLTVTEDITADHQWTDEERNAASLVIEEGVTSIGEGAFEGFSQLRSVTIPSTVTSIGARAFSGCTGVLDLVFSSNSCTVGEDAFDGLGMMATGVYVAFTDNVTKIPADLFRCGSGTNIRSVTFEGDVETIGDYAFYRCSGIGGVPDTVKRIGVMSFYACPDITNLVLPEGLESIGDDAFYDCPNIDRITFLAVSCAGPGEAGAFRDTGSPGLEFVFGDSVRRIPEHLLSQNFTLSISSLTVPSSVIEIGAGAFYQYAGPDPVFESYDSIEAIGGGAFRLSSGIETFEIGPNVSQIGDGAFDGCRGLKTLAIRADLQDMTSDTRLFGSIESDNVSVSFSGSRLPSHILSGFAGMTSLTLGGTTIIGAHALEGCSGLSSLSLDGVSEVEAYGLAGIGASSLTLPDGIVLGERALSGCLVGHLVIEGSLECASPGSLSDLVHLESLTVSGDVGEVRMSDLMPGMCDGVSLTVSIDTIGDGMFEGCSGISSLETSASYIGDRAFAGTSLSQVSIGADISYIGPGAFADIPDLRRIEWSMPYRTPVPGQPVFEGSGTSEGVVVIGTGYVQSGVFEGCRMGHLQLMAEDVRADGHAFAGSGFIEADLTSMTGIPDGFMESCTELRSVIFGTELRSIGDRAFAGTSLGEVAFPPSLRTVGDESFHGSSLTAITFLGHGVSLGDRAFADNPLETAVIQSVSSSGEDPLPQCAVMLSGTVPQGMLAEGTTILSDHPMEGYDTQPIPNNAFRYSVLGESIILPTEYPNDMIPFADRFAGWDDADGIMTAQWTDMPSPYAEPPDESWISVAALAVMALAAGVAAVGMRR